jgi:hypothetical protein
VHNGSGQIGNHVLAAGRILAAFRATTADSNRSTTMTPQLRNMLGKLIVARIPALDRENMVLVRLHTVEASGIWIESQKFNETMLQNLGIVASVTTLVLFVPFSDVDFIISSVGSIVLSEKAFGIGE